jgi:hypothetical protein
MNKYLTIATVVLLIALGISCYQTECVTDKWKTAEANVKAYSQRLNASDNKNTALQLTCSQLGYFNDSVLKALDETRKELKIKDKNLKALQAVKSKFSKKDTIRITQTDTLFREPTLNLDTLIGDKWYSLRLGLKYPSMIAVEPEFKSEKHIIVSTKKETVNPPKKFFLFRWFQRKHKVLHVDVIEKNPYIKDDTSEYVEIIK